jgi:hypothetical protein
MNNKFNNTIRVFSNFIIVTKHRLNIEVNINKNKKRKISLAAEFKYLTRIMPKPVIGHVPELFHSHSILTISILKILMLSSIPSLSLLCFNNLYCIHRCGTSYLEFNYSTISQDLWNININRCVRKSSSLIPTLKHIDPANITTSDLAKIHFNIILSPTFRSAYLSLSYCHSHQNPPCIPVISHACYMHCHFILLDFIDFVIFREEYMLRKFSLSNFKQPPTILSLFGSNILLKTLFSKIYIPYCSVNIRG